MKLDRDRIVIESRYEIDDIMDMIDVYLKSKPKMKSVTEQELKQLREQLDALFMCW